MTTTTDRLTVEYACDLALLRRFGSDAAVTDTGGEWMALRCTVAGFDVLASNGSGLEHNRAEGRSWYVGVYQHGDQVADGEAKELEDAALTALRTATRIVRDKDQLRPGV